MSKKNMFTEKEALLALVSITLWVDLNVSEGEQKSFLKLLDQEHYTKTDVKFFQRKWDDLDYIEDVFKEAIKALTHSDSKIKIKSIAWMFEIANEGGAGSRNDDETSIISQALSELKISQQDAINYYEKMIP